MSNRNKDIEERLRKKVYCAQLYYGKLPNMARPLTQGEIAKKLGISTSQVSYLLKEAYQEGLLESRIHAPRSYILEGELVHTYQQFGLQQARVAVVGGTEYESTVIDAIGDCAADYVEEELKPGMKVGISGGRTMRSMVEHIAPNKLKGLKIYSVESRGALEVSANTIAANLAAKCEDSEVYGLTIPPLTSGSIDDAQIVLDYLLSLPSISEAYDGLNRLDIAITGIATLLDHASSIKSAKYFEVELEFIEEIKKKAVGCIIWEFFDRKGRIVESDIHKRVLAIRLQHLQDMARSPQKRVIAVAGGKNKVEAIQAAIYGGFMDTLITDIDTAEKLIESMRKY